MWSALCKCMGTEKVTEMREVKDHMIVIAISNRFKTFAYYSSNCCM